MSAEAECEILLVEDSVYDAELTTRALKRRNLANRLVHVRDGAEALEYIFGTGTYAGRDINEHPKVILLDLKLPKWTVWKSCAKSSPMSTPTPSP